jgi:RsiW-degrading membrane proteinase PrsW (M82 family)
MSQKVWEFPTQPLPRRGVRWLRTLFIGLLLFIITTLVMFFTNNTNLYPTVILIGNFLIPVVFVAFLYDHQHISALDPITIAASFCIGGVLGVIGSSVLESLLLPIASNPTNGLSFGSALLVGLIEEGCKILAVIILARRMPHTSQMDGLLLGGAVGMGFAALESTGYAFTAFLLARGHIEASIATTVVRGLVAPFGHGIWSALLGAILFRESTPGRFRFNLPVILMYLFVSILHALWDGSPLAIYLLIPPGIPVSLSTIILCIVGVVALLIVYRQSLIRQMWHITSTLP